MPRVRRGGGIGSFPERHASGKPRVAIAPHEEEKADAPQDKIRQPGCPERWDEPMLAQALPGNHQDVVRHRQEEGESEADAPTRPPDPNRHRNAEEDEDEGGGGSGESTMQAG